MSERAVVLLSGGLDSTTCLAIARSEGYETYALSARYGQRHTVELEAATRIARHFEAADHAVIDLDLRRFGGSALTADIEVPKHDSVNDLSGGGVPVTYVPARNTVFLSLALGWAEVLGAQHIFIGVSSVDYSGYPDCRPEFIEAFETLANVATKAATEDGRRLTVHTPLMHLSKAETIAKGHSVGVDYAMTISCYDPTLTGEACGHCDSCLLRRKGFEDAGVPDPTRYAPGALQ